MTADLTLNDTYNARASVMKRFVTSQGVLVAREADVLGKGTYGVVYCATHEGNPDIRKAVKTFCPETMDDEEGIPATTLREINALKTLRHPNIITAEEVVIPPDASFRDILVVMELCKGTLKTKLFDMIQKNIASFPFTYVEQLHQSKGDSNCETVFDSLPIEYIKEAKIVSWQLLNALAFIHSRGVMHRDIKPANIMWGFDDLIKIGDFGLSRFLRGVQADVFGNTAVQQTGEVQTMWYRAPEVLLGDEKYGLLVDDWSVGCIIAEMFRFRRSSSTNCVQPAPLFNGRCDIETLMLIFETLGIPEPLTNPLHRYLERLPYWSQSFPCWKEGTLKQKLPLMDSQGLDLLQRLLRISPSERQSSRFLLNHAWFDDVRSSLSLFPPWYKGLESSYSRMAAINRLPLPRTMRAVINQSKGITTLRCGVKNASNDRAQQPHNPLIRCGNPSKQEKKSILPPVSSRFRDSIDQRASCSFKTSTSAPEIIGITTSIPTVALKETPSCTSTSQSLISTQATPIERSQKKNAFKRFNQPLPPTNSTDSFPHRICVSQNNDQSVAVAHAVTSLQRVRRRRMYKPQEILCVHVAKNLSRECKSNPKKQRLPIRQPLTARKPSSVPLNFLCA